MKYRGCENTALGAFFQLRRALKRSSPSKAQHVFTSHASNSSLRFWESLDAPKKACTNIREIVYVCKFHYFHNHTHTHKKKTYPHVVK